MPIQKTARPMRQTSRILRGLERREIILRQALKLLSVQALRLDDPPAHQALSRQAAVALLQMHREEQ